MITKTVNALCPAQKPLLLGRQMEDNYRQIVFDLSGFSEEITGITLVHQRKRDVAPYIVTTADASPLTWTVTNTDTAFNGYGSAELRITFADGLAKTVTFQTLVLKSITADTTIPAPLQSWYDAMIEYIDQHSTSPEQIEQAVADYLEEHPIEAPVQSVNGKTGTVVLTASDVGALPDSVTIPSRTSQLTNDSGFLSSVPAEYVTETELGTALAPKANTADLARVATSGEYADLTGKPTIPTKTSELTNDSGYITSIPSEYVTETEMQTALASKADTADIPTAVSELTNDSGYITSAGAPVQSVNGQTGAVTVTVPTKTSDLTNDSGFITSVPVQSVDGKTGAVTVIPTGGTTGQVLAKASNTDRDVEWINQSGGGGDTWRVIADITTTEEVLSINITEDSNGNPLSLKEFRVFASVPKCTQASNGQWGVNSYWMDSSGGFNTGSGRHGSFAMKLNPDNTATSIIEQFGIGGYNNTNFSAINGGFYDGRLIEARSFPNGFTAIRLRQSNTSYTLPVGTHIYVYGVDKS